MQISVRHDKCSVLRKEITLPQEKERNQTTSKSLSAGLFSDSLHFSRDDSWPEKSGLLMEIKKKFMY